MNRIPSPHRKNRLVPGQTILLDVHPTRYILKEGHIISRIPLSQTSRRGGIIPILIKRNRMVLKIFKEDTILLQIRVIFSV